MTCARHLEPMSWTTLLWVQRNTRKCDVWGCSVHTPRRLQQIANSCKRSDYNNFFTKKNRQTKKTLWVSWWVSVQNKSHCSLRPLIVWAQRSLTIFNLWAPPLFIPLPPWGTRWRRRRMPPLVLIKNWFRSLFSRFTVKTVHIYKCFSEVWSEFHRCISAWCVQWDVPVFSGIFRTLQTMDNRSDLPVLNCPSQCTFLQSSQFWAANHDMLSLSGSDREFLQISFWDISFEHCELWNALSVLQFCRAEHH